MLRILFILIAMELKSDFMRWGEKKSDSHCKNNMLASMF